MALTEVYRCSVCDELLPYEQLRQHLIEHHPSAEGLDWEDVRNVYFLERG